MDPEPPELREELPTEERELPEERWVLPLPERVVVVVCREPLPFELRLYVELLYCRVVELVFTVVVLRVASVVTLCPLEFKL